MFNFVGVTACPLPRVLDRKAQRPEYRDPLRDASAALIPMTAWDGVRLLEHTVLFVRKILGIEVFPEDCKVKKTFLWRFGFRSQLMGLSMRPILPEQALHTAKMQSAVKDGQVQMFEPFDVSSPVWRTLGDADLVPHEERVRLWRRLDCHGRKRS